MKKRQPIDVNQLNSTYNKIFDATMKEAKDLRREVDGLMIVITVLNNRIDKSIL